MRLIDADELARSHCVECTYYHKGECLGKDCDWDSIGHIRDAKTVDAIPIEWLENWFKKRYKGRTYRDLIEEWESEQFWEKEHEID